MKLIVGLGNKGSEYSKTFHNIGFMVVSSVVEKLGLSPAKCKYSNSIIAKSSNAIYAFPQTYMNLSGQAVRALVKLHKIELKDVLIVYDDCDLDKGKIRFRQSGSAGTHNGMRSVVYELDDINFPRLRIGIGKSDKIPLDEYVLSNIKKEDFDIMLPSFIDAEKIIEKFVNGEAIS